MSNDFSATIKSIANGFVVSLRDPKIEKANQGKGPWKDPNVEHGFNSIDDAVEFLKAEAKKCLPPDEYSSTFSKAVAEKSRAKR